MGALLVFVMALGANLVTFVAARHQVARLCGAYGGRLTIGLRSRSSLLVTHRLVIAGAGPLGCYLLAGVLLATGLAIAGRNVTDEASMRVNVYPNSPAASVGVRDGDRVVSVNGEAPGDWDGLKRLVRAHAGEPIQVEVERGGGRFVFTPTPGRDGKIGVGPPSSRVKASAGDVVAEGLGAPAEVIGFQVKGLVGYLRGRVEPDSVTGPVGVVRLAQSLDFGQRLQFVGMVNAYFLWVAVLFGLILLPWPSRERSG